MAGAITQILLLSHYTHCESLFRKFALVYCNKVILGLNRRHKGSQLQQF